MSIIVILSNDAQEDFIKLSRPERSKVDRKLKYLKENPFIGKPLTGELKHFFTIRAWPYRILYEFIQKEKVVKVYRIQHRKEVYKN